MNDERPRPEYGEYATPEQQARAAGQPFQPPAPDAVTRVNAAPPESPSQEQHPGGVTRAFSGDRLITLFLLGIGLFSLINAIPQYLRYSTALNAVDAQLGLGAYPLSAFADKAGIGLLIAHVLIFVLTVVWALRTLSHRKRAFYIPILGFMAFGLVYTIVLSILFHADSAFWAQIATKFG